MKKPIEIIKKIIKSFLVLIYSIFVIALVSGGLSAAILTVMPAEASKPCYLGYYALCSFTPYSTLILSGMAIVGIILLIQLIKYFRKNLKKEYRYKRSIENIIIN